MTAPWRAVVAILLGAGIAVGGWRKAALSGSGAVAAALVGAATFGLGGLEAGAGLVVFFLAGSRLSRRQTVPNEVAAAKGHRRDAAQVFANGGVAAFGAILAGFGLGRGQGNGIVLGSLAAAAADTFASEVGVRSRTPPRSVVTGRVLAPGTSGGVSLLGWAAAFVGASTIGAVYATVRGRQPGVRRPAWRRTVAIGVVSGLLGSLADSTAGALIQAGYRCRACGGFSETPRHACGGEAHLVSGVRWVTNDVVNLIGTSVGGLVGAAAWPSDGPRSRCATLGRGSRRGADRP